MFTVIIAGEFVAEGLSAVSFKKKNPPFSFNQSDFTAFYVLKPCLFKIL
jgi:hypothetical protein